MPGNFISNLNYDYNQLFRQPLPEDDVDDQGERLEEAGGDEDRGMTENFCDFTIYVMDAAGKSGMIVEATSMDTEINYNTVQMSNNIEKQRKLHRFERQMK